MRVIRGHWAVRDSTPAVLKVKGVDIISYHSTKILQTNIYRTGFKVEFFKLTLQNVIIFIFNSHCFSFLNYGMYSSKDF